MRALRGLAHVVAFRGTVPAVKGDEAGFELEGVEGLEELLALAASEPQFKDAELLT